jgi:glutamyl-tRNA reductase
MRHRRTHPLFEVFLYNIADLRSIAMENRSDRGKELNCAEVIVTEELILTLAALRERFEATRRTELTRLEPKLSALSLEARTRLDEISRLIVEKLLLTATEQLKSIGNGRMGIRYADVLNRLFQLVVDDKGESRSEDSESAVSTRRSIETG